MDVYCSNPRCDWKGEIEEAIAPDPAEVPTFPPDHAIHDARFCPECGWQCEMGACPFQVVRVPLGWTTVTA